jgi:hypothetical protein
LEFGISSNACAIERRPGAIKTSDGLELKGEVWFNNGEVKIYEGEDAALWVNFLIQHSVMHLEDTLPMMSFSS